MYGRKRAGARENERLEPAEFRAPGNFGRGANLQPTSLPIADYTTKLGTIRLADSIAVMKALERDSIDLTMTSPPFALTRKKEYGNEQEGLTVLIQRLAASRDGIDRKPYCFLVTGGDAAELLQAIDATLDRIAPLVGRGRIRPAQFDFGGMTGSTPRSSTSSRIVSAS